MPYNIPDDPIIRCMERTGLPPWEVYSTYREEDDPWFAHFDEDDEEEKDEEDEEYDD